MTARRTSPVRTCRPHRWRGSPWRPCWTAGCTSRPSGTPITYRTWLENLRDWPISRQLWWGHQIPVWKRPVDDSPLLAERTNRDRQGLERSRPCEIRQHEGRPSIRTAEELTRIRLRPGRTARASRGTPSKPPASSATPTCWTRGSARRCGRSDAGLAGRDAGAGDGSTRATCCAPPARSSRCGSAAWSCSASIAAATSPSATCSSTR